LPLYHEDLSSSTKQLRSAKGAQNGKNKNKRLKNNDLKVAENQFWGADVAQLVIIEVENSHGI